MVRRILLVSCAMLFLWAAPAAAQSYGDAVDQQGTGGIRFDTGQVVFIPFEVQVQAQGDRGILARTGSGNLVPLVQGGIVLIGGGSLLALVARRRRAQRRVDIA